MKALNEDLAIQFNAIPPMFEASVPNKDKFTNISQMITYP